MLKSRRAFRAVNTLTATWISLALVAATMGPATAARSQEAVRQTHVAGGVWRIDGAIDVIVLQAGPDGMLMVDTGYPFAEEGVRGALVTIGGTDRVDRIVNTHAHHAFSNHIYGRGAEIMAHRNAARRLEGGFLMAGEAVPPIEPSGRPTRTFADSLRFHFNGEDITLLHLPGAHTDGDVAVFFHGSNVVATGDAYVPHMPWISLDQGADVWGLLAALDVLLERIPEDARVVPGHDGVTLGKGDVRAFRGMIAEAADTVAARMEAGLSLRMIQELGLPTLSAWRGDVPEKLFLESLYRSFVRARPNPNASTLELVGGRWWDGSGFVTRTLYVVDGIFTDARPASIERHVDLAGGWVVPGLGDAHVHALSDTSVLEQDARGFTTSGTFYAMVQDPAAPIGPPRRLLGRRAALPDVAFTQGVVTPSWGVVTEMYEIFVGMGRFGPGVERADVEGRLFFTVDTIEQLAAAWPELLRMNDRFIKVIIAFSDDIDRRRASPETYGARIPDSSAKPGVTIEVLRELVRRAHGSGLSVSAHIETAADFRAAVGAGVDWIAHMPAAWQVGDGTGYGADERDPWLLTPSDARGARARGTMVVTTLASRAPGDSREALFRSVHRENLRLLADAGVTLAIGSDRSDGSVVDEALYLRSLGVLSETQILNLLASQTPRLVFPELRVGHLRPGYEASFLVLGSDPTQDLGAITDIRVAYKRGERVR